MIAPLELKSSSLVSQHLSVTPNSCSLHSKVLRAFCFCFNVFHLWLRLDKTSQLYAVLFVTPGYQLKLKQDFNYNKFEQLIIFMLLVGSELVTEFEQEVAEIV